MLFICFLLSFISQTTARHYPPFTYTTVPTYVQASNRTGLFNTDALNYLIKQKFIVLDSDQGVNASPINSNAESKIIAAAKQIKTYAKLHNVQAVPDIYMYSQIDYSRTLYSAGKWFEQHPQYLLHNMDGSLASEPQGHIYDHQQKIVQQKWASTIANPVLNSDGALNGVFIDGYRYETNHSNGYLFLGNVSNATAYRWMKGTQESSAVLRSMLPLSKYTIINNPGVYSSKGADGIMIETFFPSDSGIQELIQEVATGRIVQVHSAVNKAPYLNNTHQLWAFEVTLAGFLCGMGDYSYFGGGVEWGNVTNWMQPHVDYKRVLGKPTGNAKRINMKNGSWLYTRSFRNENNGITNVSHQTSPLASCIQWSDGSISNSGLC